jgi:hypothetical protein
MLRGDSHQPEIIVNTGRLPFSTRQYLMANAEGPGNYCLTLEANIGFIQLAPIMCRVLPAMGAEIIGNYMYREER